MELVIVVLAFSAGWGTIWWRLGRLETRMNGVGKEWRHLKNRCPLCQIEPMQRQEKGKE